jgi:hypothetical protein
MARVAKRRLPTPESQILHDIRLELGREPDLVLWRVSSGAASYGRAVVRYGLTRGCSDLIGIFTTCSGLGVLVALEVKAERGRLSEDQRLFLQLVQARGGLTRVVRSVFEARAQLAVWRSLDRRGLLGVCSGAPLEPTK